jgi:hypothetical protein
MESLTWEASDRLQFTRVQPLVGYLGLLIKKLKTMTKRRRLFAEYRSEKNPNFDTIELAFSCLHFISGNYRWFCRIWDKDWIDKIGRGKKAFGESYGKNKFEAYRLALKDLREGRENYA